MLFLAVDFFFKPLAPAICLEALAGVRFAATCGAAPLFAADLLELLAEVLFLFLASALAIESASQSFLLDPPWTVAFRLLFHSADPASPAICFSERLVRTE